MQINSLRRATVGWTVAALGAALMRRSALGAVTSAIGVFVIPAVPYLQALRLEKEALVQAMGLASTVSTVALGAGLLLDSGLKTAAGGSLLALVPVLAGMLLGQHLRKRMPDQLFKRFFIGLFYWACIWW